MKIPMLAVGIFVVCALVLFGGALFLIGDRHKAFSRHEDLYTEIGDVNGLVPGSKVRVSGYDAGELTSLQIPGRPSAKFRLRLHVDNALHKLIRQDSFVSVETDGIVGDKYLQIQQGSDNAPVATPGTTLPSKEPIEISAILNKATGIIDQANATIGDLRTHLDGTLDEVKTTVSNTNGLVSEARHGKGTVGMLLEDQVTANRIKEVITNADQASANLNQVSVQAKEVVSDFQSRGLPQKVEDTLNNAKDASHRIDLTTQQLSTTLNSALAPDSSGTTAAQNIRETLSNVNLATANLADDTEALKHEFFFRGFFKKRGFYSLTELTPDQYRASKYFQNPKNQRDWLDASKAPAAFTHDPQNNEILSEVGKMQIDQFIGAAGESVMTRPIVVEGYANQTSPAEEMIVSRSRSLLVSVYLEKRFHLAAKNIGIMPLEATPPVSSGKSSCHGSCNGASIVMVAEAK
jgi:phospholipid/cholesterol/gamma-HCH transport system substrate-binding protein